LVSSIVIHQNKEPETPSTIITKAKFLLQEPIETSINLEEIAKELPMATLALEN
jgi:hypothetical protein